ncbi:hypothetical protein JCM33374_g2002 [Metschnikowia sp. JCM 33374]|nr:hypothetical protein JCM33374_g2002 [Metschnikowia sp. JCM 33374]
MCHNRVELDEAETQAGQEERREKRQIECPYEHQSKSQKNDHSRYQYYLKMYCADGDVYEFVDCIQELLKLYGTEKYEPLRQKIIERKWQLPIRACKYYYHALGVDYEYPDPPF